MNDPTSSGPPMDSSSAQRAQAESAARPGDMPSGAARPVTKDQPTVISNRPPIMASEEEWRTSAELGKLGPGSLLGHFELVEPIGGGGMGRVFRATDTRLGRTVALKVLSRQQAGDPETLLRFHNEARSAARLNHENIVQVYYVGEDKGLPFIASEFVQGANIRDTVLRRGSLPLGEAISYTLQVAEALRHAAEHNVVHRDVKPSNVLVTADGQAKLIDLGLARLQSRDDSGSDLTASGVTLGTFDYISPEQARDPRIADVRSDIYSLGCTLFYMLAGRPPFPQGTVLQKLLQHQGDDPPDVRVFRPDVPEEVSRVVRKMMAKDPHRRYRDPAKLIVALWSLAEQIGLRPVGLGSRAWAVPKQRGVSLVQRHLPWAAPVAVLVGVVLLLHMLWSPPAEPEDVLFRELTRAPDQVSPELQAPGESPQAEDNGLQRETFPMRPEQSPADGGQEPGAPPASAAETSSAENVTQTAPSDDGAGQIADGSPLALEEDKPMDGIDAESDDAGSLRPAGLDGHVSMVEVYSVGLSAGRQPGQDWGELRGDVPLGGESNVGGSRADTAPGTRRLWTVDPNRQGGADFTTLSAACHVAADGDVIELRYDGRVEAKPLALANLEVTLRAGEGFQPIVVFEPSEVDPIKYPRSMFTLTGTRLTLTDLAIELNVPREVPADSWTVFEMGHADQVRLEKCSLTVRNASVGNSGRPSAYHPDVAFFRLKTVPGSDTVLGSEPAARRRTSVRLDDCIVRGEAVVLHTEDLQPVDLAWENGLLVTTQWLLVADGGDRAPQPAETIRIHLRHLTAVVGGLCQLNRSEFAPHQLFAQIDCSRSILASSGVNPGCVIEQVGAADVEQALWQVDWSGEGNFYGAFAAFWGIRSLDSDIPPVEMTFEQWQIHWAPERESGVRLDAGAWRKLPDPDTPVHSHTPADYALIDAAGFDSTVAGGVGSAGLQAARLPLLPQQRATQEMPNGQSTN